MEELICVAAAVSIARAVSILARLHHALEKQAMKASANVVMEITLAGENVAWWDPPVVVSNVR